MATKASSSEEKKKHKTKDKDSKKDYKIGLKMQGEYKGKSLAGKANELLEVGGKQIKGSAKEILSGISSLASPAGSAFKSLNKLRNRKKKADFQKGDYSDIKIKKADGGRIGYKHGGGCAIKGISPILKK